MKSGHRVTALMLLFSLSLAGLARAKEDGLVAHYDFRRGAGGILRDVSGHGNHGRIHGAKWVERKQGHALWFDGEDDYVDCGAGASLDIRKTVTVEVWVKPESDPGVDVGIAGKNAKRVRLEAMEYGLDSRAAGTVCRLPDSLPRPESRASAIGSIAEGVKPTGKPGAGNPHAGFDEAGTGNGAVGLPRQSSTLQFPWMMWALLDLFFLGLASHFGPDARDATRHCKIKTCHAYFKNPIFHNALLPSLGSGRHLMSLPSTQLHVPGIPRLWTACGR